MSALYIEMWSQNLDVPALGRLRKGYYCKVRSVWSTQWMPGQPTRHRKDRIWKQTTRNFTELTYLTLISVTHSSSILGVRKERPRELYSFPKHTGLLWKPKFKTSLLNHLLNETITSNFKKKKTQTVLFLKQNASRAWFRTLVIPALERQGQAYL